ncbi:glycosyltransferase [Phage DSL-LC06]|nr:glycosyltransferase [Phage DSL-LC06]
MKAYIISYFGEKLETQWRRQALHYQQLCCLLQQPGIEEIVVLAQDYDKLMKNGVVTRPAHYLFLNHPRIRYIEQSDVLTPGQARNVLIKDFNKSQDYWGMFLDNDAIVDPRWHGVDCVNIIERNAKELANIASVLSVMSPRHQPYNQYLEDNKILLETHMPIVKTNYNKTTLFFLRNETVIGNQPVLFDDELPCLEDYEYCARQLASGGAIYQIKSVVMNDMGCDEKHSTLFPGWNDESDRTQWFKDIKEQIYQRYAPYGLKKTQDGNTLRWNTIGNNKQLTKNYFVSIYDNNVTQTLEKEFNNNFKDLFDEE